MYTYIHIYIYNIIYIYIYIYIYIIYIYTKFALIQLSNYDFLTLLLNKKTKMNTGIFMSFKSQVYSKHGSPTCLLFGLWSLVLVVGNRATQDTFLKYQGKFFLSFLCTLFYIFLKPKNYKSSL